MNPLGHGTMGTAAKWALFAFALTGTGAARAEPAAEALKFIGVGVTLYKAGDYEAARGAFAHARDLEPDKPGPYRWVGLTEAKLGQCKQALVSLGVFLSGIPRDDPRRPEAEAVREGCRKEIKTGHGDSPPGEVGASGRIRDPFSPLPPAREQVASAVTPAPPKQVAFSLPPKSEAESRTAVPAPPPAAREKKAIPLPVAGVGSRDLLAAPGVIVPEVIERPNGPAKPEHKPVYKKWWPWTIAAAVIIGAAVGVGVGAARTPDDAALPSSDLGTMAVRF